MNNEVSWVDVSPSRSPVLQAHHPETGIIMYVCYDVNTRGRALGWRTCVWWEMGEKLFSNENEAKAAAIKLGAVVPLEIAA